MNESDLAEKYESMERDIAIENATTRTRETPEFDKEGNRVCVECLELIPEERVKAVDAVRCVGCQTAIEKYDNQFAI